MRKYTIHLKQVASLATALPPETVTVEADDIEIDTNTDTVLLNFVADGDTVGLIPLDNIVAVVSQE